MRNSRKRDIENDFLEYDFSDDIHQEQVKESNGLGSIIQLLIIIILVGIIAVGGLFGYKYFKGDIEKSDQNIVQNKETQENKRESKKVSSSSKESSSEQKMYTQEQMKAIVQLMMEQINKENLKVKKEDKSNNEDLVSSLADIEVDSIDKILTTKVNKADITHKVTKKSDDQIDRYNKVVVKKSNNDSFANQLNSAIENIDIKESENSTYTKSISNEIETREDEMRFIIVKEGDSLSKIAKRAYGSVNAYNIIIEANPDLIKNPNRIYVGQRLRIPTTINQ